MFKCTTIETSEYFFSIRCLAHCANNLAMWSQISASKGFACVGSLAWSVVRYMVCVGSVYSVHASVSFPVHSVIMLDINIYIITYI